MKAFNLLVSYLLKTHNFKIRSKSLPKKVEKSRRGRDKSKTVGGMILHNLLYMVLPTSNFIKNRILYDCFSYASSDPLLLHARNQRRMVSTNNFTFKDWIITNRFIKHHLQLTFFFLRVTRKHRGIPANLLLYISTLPSQFNYSQNIKSKHNQKLSPTNSFLYKRVSLVKIR